MAKKASERARTSRNRRAPAEQISPSRARMLGGGADEDDEQDAAPARRHRANDVPPGWRKPAAGVPRANRDAARTFANRGANAVGKPVAFDVGSVQDAGDENDAGTREAANFVDDMLDGVGAGTSNAVDANDEAAALAEIQEFVLTLASRYTGDGRLKRLFEDPQFMRAFPNARVVDATTVDVGNGTLVDVVDRTVRPTAGARSMLRDRMDAALTTSARAQVQEQVQQLLDSALRDTGPQPPGAPERMRGIGAINDELRAAARERDQQVDVDKAAGDARYNQVMGAGDYMTVSPETARQIGGVGLGATIRAAAASGAVGPYQVLAGNRGEPIRLPNGQPAISYGAPPAPQLDLADVTHQDLDQLWDWTRSDPNGVRDFLGTLPAHTRALYDWLYGVLTLQENKRARINSIIVNRRLIGFVVLAPIDRDSAEPKASVHLYLEPGVRGILPQLLPALLQVAEVAEPGVTLMIETRRQEWARILERVGFVSSLVLTRRPRYNSKG